MFVLPTFLNFSVLNEFIIDISCCRYITYVVVFFFIIFNFFFLILRYFSSFVFFFYLFTFFPLYRTHFFLSSSFPILFFASFFYSFHFSTLFFILFNSFVHLYSPILNTSSLFPMASFTPSTSFPAILFSRLFEISPLINKPPF